nr:unnamed protein product [Digitaria exilis]
MVRKPSHVDDAGAGNGGAESNKERKGLWSPEEDERLFTQITYHGVSTWSSSCRLRWMNYLRPDLKKEPITKREEELIVSLQRSLGNRWSTIAARMPGRTDNEIKNYWNSRIRKRLNAAAKQAEVAAGTEPPPPPPPAAEKKVVEVEPVNNGGTEAGPMPIPARFPVFECQLVDAGGGGGGGCISSAGSGESTPSTTTTSTQQNSGDDSEASVGESNMIHFLSFDDLDYPAGDFLVDLPGAMDAWESELYPANSTSSLY